MNTIIDKIDLWTTAQELKTSNRGRSASNQSLLGIKKLRQLILDLAVRGKLVPQDPNDEPVTELVKKIRYEKNRLETEGKIKRQVALPAVGEDEKEFDLPLGWGWQKLGNLGYTQTGGTPSKNDNSLFGNDVPFIKPGDIYPNRIDYANEGLSFKGVESLGRLANECSILMVCIGTIGKCNTINRPCTFNQQINSISPYGISSDYLLLALNSKYFQDKAWEKSSSTTIAILNKGKWENIGIPVAPLAEQHRIVAKVDELMALCDELENQQTDSNIAHETLVATLLGSLTDAENSNSFDELWQRIANHFDILFTTEHSIVQLKQTILQLAVMGKLVAQNPADEPASELLKKIAKEKAKLVKEGKIKKQAPLPDITEDEKPFELPDGWDWVRLQTIVFLLGDGLHGTPEYTPDTKYYFVNGNNLKNGKIEIKPDTKTVSKDEMLKYKKVLTSNSILVSINGTLGSVAFYNGEEIMLGKSACYFNLSENIFKYYIKLLLESPYFMEYAFENATGSTIKNLGLKAMNELPILLPPLAEQHRVVSKVDELFGLCDGLKERLVEAQTLQNQLAVVVVEHALN